MTYLVDSPELARRVRRSAICADCLTTRLGATRQQAQDIFARMAKRLTIITKVTRCDSCLKRTVVRRLG